MAHATREITNTISKKPEIAKFVFQGIGNFEEPFTASWLYEHDRLKKAGPIHFTVKTGSGRSRGDFTVVVKPA